MPLGLPNERKNIQLFISGERNLPCPTSSLKEKENITNAHTENTLKPFGHVLKKLFRVRNMGILCPSIYNEAPPSPGAKAE